MAEWIISGNPQNYDVVGAFHELKRVDWTQSANIDVGDIVYIYVSGDIKMLLFKCRANKVNITVPDIEDQKFNVSGKYDGHMGRYMELEMLEEFDGPEYSREELIKHGFQSPMGPMHMPDSVSEYLEGLRNYSQSSIGKYSVSSSVWIATALMAANVYSQNINADREKYYFKQSEIREKAQEYANGKVEPARISWWCCADGPKNTYNYLRADNENDNTLRRLTSPVELDGIKTLPTDLSPSLDDTIFYILGHDFSLEDLFTFVQEKYSKIWEDENEWWPSLTEYDPEISSKQWFRLLKDESVTSHETLVMLK